MKQLIITIPDDVIKTQRELDNVLKSYTQTSDFKRAMYRLAMGKSHRGTEEELEDEMEELLPKFKFQLRDELIERMR